MPQSVRAAEDAALARLKVDLATAAADATPLADLDPTARDLTRVLPLLEQVLRAVTDLLGTSRGAVWVADPATRELYAVCWLGLPDSMLNSLRVPYGRGSVGRAAHERQPVLVTEIEQDPLFAEAREEADRIGVGSAFSMPMLTLTGEPMGTLTAYYDHPTQPAAREQSLVELYARQAAEIVERARMHAEARQLAELERRRAGQLRALATAALALSSVENLDELLRSVTDSARTIVGAQRGVATRVATQWTDETRYVSLADDSTADISYDVLEVPLVGRSGAGLGLLQLAGKLDGTPFTAEDEAILVQ